MLSLKLFGTDIEPGRKLPPFRSSHPKRQPWHLSPVSSRGCLGTAEGNAGALQKAPQSESLDSAISSALSVSPSYHGHPAHAAIWGGGHPWVSPYWDSEPVLTCSVTLRMRTQSSERSSNWPQAAQQMHGRVGIGARVLPTEGCCFVHPGSSDQRVTLAVLWPAPHVCRGH